MIETNWFDKDSYYCNKEKLEKFYNYYLLCLKNSPFLTEWASIYQIEKVDSFHWQTLGDKYLSNSKNDRNKFANDLLENCTYWPLIVKRKGDNFELSDGVHRAETIRSLANQGIWTKDLLLLINEPQEKLQCNTLYIPNVVNYQFKIKYMDIYSKVYNQDIKYADEEQEIIEYQGCCINAYSVVMCWSLLLRNCFFDYKELTGDIIKPAKVINDYDSWKEWRGY